MPTRPPYAPTYNYPAGVQTAYDAGLSYFPDYAVPTPLGDIASDISMAVGGVVGGPAGAAGGGVVTSVIRSWLGGSAVDQQRQARVNYFAQLAAQGNVAAMQLILGGPQNVSGNESQMWTTAAQLVQQANPGVYAAAMAAGPAWLTNSGDTATNYPRMRAFVQAWATQNPVATVTGSVGNAISQFFNPTPIIPTPPVMVNGVPTYPAATHSALSPTLLVGGAALAAVLLLRKRGRR